MGPRALLLNARKEMILNPGTSGHQLNLWKSRGGMGAGQEEPSSYHILPDELHLTRQPRVLVNPLCARDSKNVFLIFQKGLLSDRRLEES